MSAQENKEVKIIVNDVMHGIMSGTNCNAEYARTLENAINDRVTFYDIMFSNHAFYLGGGLVDFLKCHNMQITGVEWDGNKCVTIHTTPETSTADLLNIVDTCIAVTILDEKSSQRAQLFNNMIRRKQIETGCDYLTALWWMRYYTECPSKFRIFYKCIRLNQNVYNISFV